MRRKASEGLATNAVIGLYLFGWVLLLQATFLIDHFDLFGLKKVWRRLMGKTCVPRAIPHAEPLQGGASFALHRLADHILVGAHDDIAHLVFAAMTTAYIPDRDPA